MEKGSLRIARSYLRSLPVAVTIVYLAADKWEILRVDFPSYRSSSGTRTEGSHKDITRNTITVPQRNCRRSFSNPLEAHESALNARYPIAVCTPRYTNGSPCARLQPRKYLWSSAVTFEMLASRKDRWYGSTRAAETREEEKVEENASSVCNETEAESLLRDAILKEIRKWPKVRYQFQEARQRISVSRKQNVTVNALPSNGGPWREPPLKIIPSVHEILWLKECFLNVFSSREVGKRINVSSRTPLKHRLFE